MNTFKKYIFEIIVIFVGITMSFIFEEWRNSRQEDKEENELYLLLLADIKSDSVDLTKLFEGLDFEQPRMDSILRKQEYADIGRFAHDMCAPFAFINNQNFLKSFESIRQSGDLKIFKSKDLINKCNYILALQNQLNVTINAESEVWTNYRNYLSKVYPDMALYCIRYQSRKGIKGKITDKSISTFLNDPQIMVFYNDLLWTSQYVRFNSTRIKKELEELRIMLKEELNK